MLARLRTASCAAALLGAPVVALTIGCSAPPSHFTRLWVQGQTGVPAIGVSTESGVLTLSSPDWKVGDRFDLQFPVGNSLVNDIATIDRLNETIAIVLPATAKLTQGRFATSLPAPQEQLYVALRNEVDEAVMQPVSSWRDGEYGDWILVPGFDDAHLEQIATEYRGTGLYVRRGGRWEIVGLLAGLLATDEADPRGELALGYIGLIELARILPREKDYLLPNLKPLRPDFEFGVPLQPGDLQVESEEEEPEQGQPEPPEPVPPPAPTPR